jgi:putative membrane protein
MDNSNPNHQRDHQANERTYLAWLRTSLALIGFGFAIARFGLFTRQISFALSNQPSVVHPIFNSENLGLGFVLSGILTIGMATWRFNEVFQQIERQNFQARKFLIWFMTGLVIALGALSVPLVLWRGDSFSTPKASSLRRLP